jgi:diguanylate cyclase (GGDEF)-like protein
MEFREVLKNLDSKDSVILGKKDDRLLGIDINDYPSIIITGAPGTGKSVLVDQIICQLISTHTSLEMGLVLVDTTGVELNKYAVVVMDLNGLKHTDDTLGHRYGCQLIIEFGHQLPSIFEHSRLFHTGGDEFVAICANEDYENLPTLLNKFEERFAYQEIIFEEQTLVLSVAIGSAKHLSNTSYNEVFQRADENMYKNKEKIKEKYNIVSR